MKPFNLSLTCNIFRKMATPWFLTLDALFFQNMDYGYIVSESSQCSDGNQHDQSHCHSEATQDVNHCSIARFVLRRVTTVGVVLRRVTHVNIAYIV
jgi:hypothetical protein